jgi:hypothetical protein
VSLSRAEPLRLGALGYLGRWFEVRASRPPTVASTLTASTLLLASLSVAVATSRGAIVAASITASTAIVASATLTITTATSAPIALRTGLDHGLEVLFDGEELQQSGCGLVAALHDGLHLDSVQFLHDFDLQLVADC